MNLERPGAVVAAGNAREGDAARGLPSRGRRFERRILDQVGVGGDGHGGAARAALAIVHPERDGPPSGSKGVRRDRGALRADHRAVAEVERVARERPVGVGRGGGVGSHRERGHPGRRGDGQRRLGPPIHVGDREGGERRARESVAGRERHRIGTAPVGEARSPGQGSRGIARAGNEGRVVARRQVGRPGQAQPGVGAHSRRDVARSGDTVDDDDAHLRERDAPRGGRGARGSC